MGLMSACYQKYPQKSADTAPPPPPPPPVESTALEMEEDLAFEVPSNEPKEETAPFDTEAYDHIVENDFKNALREPLSTLSIDVDYAAYSNVRRFLNNDQLPPAGAVRLEEMINYFDYDYPEPKGEAPCEVITEMAPSPWNSNNRLLHIGLQARSMPQENLPPANLVFLLDVSGSMDAPNKLPLLKDAFRLLIDQLRPADRVAIVVYAGAAGLVLPSTPGSNRQKIRMALEALQAGGSTAGAQGIQQAYQVARNHFISQGNNRVILATDGDFNVGMSSDDALVRLIEEERKSGIFLSVFGFGTGNYKDNKMEKLANNGNGHYAYIDKLSEAKKVLVNEFSSSLYTVAKDVKLQLEFNPAQVAAYRLIGYENRLLNHEDFNNDAKDAGDMGAGHSVTVLYEIIPTTNAQHLSDGIDPLKYQEAFIDQKALHTDEWATLKMRYKPIQSDQSKKLVWGVVDTGQGLEQSSNNFRFSAAVAGFGMNLRQSKYRGDYTYDQLKTLAESAKGADLNGYRAEMIQLLQKAKRLSQGLTARK